MSAATAGKDRLLITASRKWSDEEVIREAILAYGPGIVVHGDAEGGDTIADRIAEELMQAEPDRWGVEAHPAYWRMGSAAGPIRNQNMVDLGAKQCLAFPLEDSIGTFDCAARAILAGIPVNFWTPLDEDVLDAKLEVARRKVLKYRRRR